MRSRVILALALAGLGLAADLRAETPPRLPGAHGLASASVEVAVNYSFSVPVAGDDVATQAKTLEAARRMLYEVAAGECANMLATFAKSCQLLRMNVTAAVHRHQPAQQMAQVGANASYKVELK